VNLSPALDRLLHLLSADLHCHSCVSDGTLRPEALAAPAKAGGRLEKGVIARRRSRGLSAPLCCLD
jgi:hypothetical protein